MRVLNIEHDATSPPGSPRSASSVQLGHSASPSISLTRLAWFDANGDGRIDTRSAGDGGDATLLVPTHEVDLPTYGRAANPRIDARAAKPNEPVGTATPPSVNPARAQQAADAYQRYGQAPAAPSVSAAQPSGVADATSAASAVGSTPTVRAVA